MFCTISNITADPPNQRTRNKIRTQHVGESVLFKNMEQDSDVGLLGLPKEIIQVILSRLDYWRWLLYSRATCRQLLQIVSVRAQ
jgi:hypothetical protein